MARRTQVSASVLDCDLADLERETRRVVKGGADRVHLDVMDGHFVPNITFGPTVIKDLRPATKRPFDAHLMISEPGRYLDKFIAAGCNSITFHVEVEEPKEPTLVRIRKAGVLAGLAIKPGTPLTELAPYADLIDIVMVMTVEPGFGGQKFMVDAAKKIGPAHDVFRDRDGERPSAREVHVDGGVNKNSAAICGAGGAEVLVVGSVLWKKGTDILKEIKTIKDLADEARRLRAGAAGIAAAARGAGAAG